MGPFIQYSTKKTTQLKLEFIPVPIVNLPCMKTKTIITIMKMDFIRPPSSDGTMPQTLLRLASDEVTSMEC